jgi:hypothetical protein
MKLKYFLIPLFIVGIGYGTFVFLTKKKTKMIRERGFEIEVEIDEPQEK